MTYKSLLRIFSGLALFFVLIFSPLSSRADEIIEGNFNFTTFDFYFPLFQVDPVFPQTIYSIDLSQENYLFTGLIIDNSLSEEFSVVSGFDPTLGLNLDTSESVQQGFLLLDGTLGIDIYTTGETDVRRIEGRSGLLTTYRISAPQGLRSDVRWTGARTEGRIGLRADGARWNGLRWNGARWSGARWSGKRISNLSDARVFRLDGTTNTWKRGIRAIQDIGRAEVRFLGDSSPDGVLGHYGYNSTNNYVWAVLDTNSKYAIGLAVDIDEDGFKADDNCPNVYNVDQVDNDADGIGDLCDTDDDNDSVVDTSDNCQFVSNLDQVDNDGDQFGDACDTDDDNDGVDDSADNCHYVSNPNQTNLDGDGFGDVCDDDPDGDGLTDDNCPLIPNVFQENNDLDDLGDVCDLDDDNDGIDDSVDNCDFFANFEQADLDQDGIGDACDSDIDGDGISNGDDNCNLIYNVGQEDADGDRQGNECDDDDDADGFFDVEDNCPLIANNDQNDADLDGQGDACDGDLDGDGIANSNDNCPGSANTSQKNWDGDTYGDVCDEDIDGDGVLNAADVCGFTEVGVQTDLGSGCSISQLCPCSGPRGVTSSWKNHGKYVSCVAKTSESFVFMELITEADKDMIVSGAAQSTCGDK